MAISKVDDRKRLIIPDAKPGQLFSIERKPDGFKLTELVPKQARSVKPIRVKGRLRPPPDFRPSPEQLAKAIREDRDAR